MQINNIAQSPDPAYPQPSSQPDYQPPQIMPAPSESQSKMTKPRREGLGNILSTILILILAPLIALFLITFVFQSYQVDGQSMETTLQHQDRLIILKTGKTWASLWNNDFIPKRGDIIVFHKDNISTFGSSGDKQLIKRVIALPGERITIKDNVVTVFNNEYPAGFQPDEESAYGNSISATPGNVDTIVSDGSVFVLGDNRLNSRDSRDFGPVAADDIVGHLSLRIFPLNKLDSF